MHLSRRCDHHGVYHTKQKYIHSNIHFFVKEFDLIFPQPIILYYSLLLVSLLTMCLPHLTVCTISQSSYHCLCASNILYRCINTTSLLLGMNMTSPGKTTVRGCRFIIPFKQSWFWARWSAPFKDQILNKLRCSLNNLIITI